MMNKRDSTKELEFTSVAGIERLKQLNVDISNDDFVIVQEYDNGQAIVIKMEDDEQGKRTMNFHVNSATVVLPKKEGTLDIFDTAEEWD